MTPITKEQAETLANKHSVGSGGNCTVDLPALLTDFRQQVIADLARESGAMLNLPPDLQLSARQLEVVQAKHAEFVASLQAKIDRIEEERDTAATDRFDEMADLRAELEQSEARAKGLEGALSLLRCNSSLSLHQIEIIDATLNKEPGHEA
jgi:hypothetical protein